jgi:hypothetical protein
MNEQEHETPVWHACVGEGYEPVLIGERTADNEDELLARGWVEQQNSGGFIYSGGMRPRRRRKQCKIVVWRLCARPSAAMDCTAELKWIQSGLIQKPWHPLEQSGFFTDSFETVKYLPEGTSP